MANIPMITQPNEDSSDNSVESEVLLPEPFTDPPSVNLAKSTVSTLSCDKKEHSCYHILLGKRKGVRKNRK